jgi:hypothetical protein
VLDHRRHSCLLQHDLRKPYAVGIAACAPGQIAAVKVVPGEDVLPQTAWLRNRKQALNGLPRLHVPQLTRERERRMDFLRARCRICGDIRNLWRGVPASRSARHRPKCGRHTSGTCTPPFPRARRIWVKHREFSEQVFLLHHALSSNSLEGSNPFLKPLGLRGDQGWVVEGVSEYGYALRCG